MTKNTAIAAGLVLGLAFGLTAAATEVPVLDRIALAVEPIGTAFVNLVRMVVVPLVAATVFTGVVRLGDPRRLGRLGSITLAFFIGTMLIGIVIGMLTMALALPIAPETTPPPPGDEPAQQLPGTVDFLLGLIPTNVVDVAARGALLPLVVFSMLFGAAVGTLPAPARTRLTELADAVTSALITLVHWVLWTAPLGVFALAAAATARSGWSMLQNLAIFVLAVLVGLTVFVVVVYLPAIKFLARRPIGPFLRAAAAPAMIGASSTSSAAALPALFEAADRDLRISPGIAGFVLSLGAAINRAGSGLFQGAAVIFLASLYGVSFSPAMLVTTIFATLLVALTVAGVPSASLVALVPVLSGIGVPVAGLALLFGVDRIPDMARTATQVVGHLVTAAVAQRMVGDGDYDSQTGAGVPASSLAAVAPKSGNIATTSVP